MSVDQRQVIAAQRVNEAASAADVTQLNRQIYALAQEYDLRRSTMEFSPERTRVLDGIVAKMRVLHGPTYGLLPQLVAGSTPGERLAALAFLQMRPSPEYLEWLSRRFEEEKPFLEYHAALALRAAAETLGPQHQAAIRSAIETARKAGLDKATKAIVDAAAKAVGMED